jgi:NADPH-dependent ferric siderophore reductase
MAEDRPFDVRVARVTRLSPVFTRVTLAADDLVHFSAHGFDQRINLLFCDDGNRRGYAGEDWFERWRAAPDAGRPPLRTYTVRAFRPAACELDIDFVVHGDAGPASRWANRARPGDPLIIIGPVAGVADPAADVAWAPPPGAGRLLIAADESALPAAAAIAEALPAGRAATIVAEVPEPADAVPFDAPAGATVQFLARSRGESLLPVVRELAGEVFRAGPGPAGTPDLDPESDWEVPERAADGRDYAWLAGEAGTVVALRRFLVGERGVDRRSVAFMGYWRRGRAQPN